MPMPTFATEAEIPEAFKGEYEEGADKKWHPKTEDSKLQSALDDERTKREAAEKLTKKVAKELADLQTKQKATDAGITDEQLQKIRADVKAEYEAEVAPIRTERETLAAENRTLKLVDVVKRAAGEGGFLPTRLSDFWTLHGADFDLTADGKPMVKASPGIEIKKHIEEIAKARPEWVAGTKANGGGANGSHNGSTTLEMPAGTPEQRLAAAHAAGAKQ